jgi:hypothetical protein
MCWFGQELLCVQRLTPVTLELGGKDAFVVCEDADLNQVCVVFLFGVSLVSSTWRPSSGLQWVPAGVQFGSGFGRLLPCACC